MAGVIGVRNVCNTMGRGACKGHLNFRILQFESIYSCWQLLAQNQSSADAVLMVVVVIQPRIYATPAKPAVPPSPV